MLVFYLRKGLISLPDAKEIMEQASLLLRDKEFEVQSEKVLDIAVTSGCTAYDCDFVTLAEDFQIPLITVDRKILEQFPQIAVPLDAFIE